MAARAPVATPIATANERHLPLRTTQTPAQAPNRSGRTKGETFSQKSPKGGKGG